MKLVIIEGPGKRETLKKYLGSGYDVMATKGHVRDLLTKGLSVDMKNNFAPHYDILPDKKDVVTELKKRASKADEVLLATDPDREGEAISWHIAHILNLKPEDKCRIEFHEISKKAVEEALKNPRVIDQKLVDAQQARRVLDRIMGYKLSPIICKAVKPKLSAGRVQSVALKLIVDREKEIRDFKPEEYWTVTSELKKQGQKTIFKANLNTYKAEKIKPTNKEQVDKIQADLKDANYTVKNIKKSKTKSNPLPPYTTSTMQQDALNKLGMSLTKTSQCAQILYEGVELGHDGKTALITYIRTDSTRVSQDAMNAARNYINSKYGSDFVPAKPNIYATKKNAQDAHEAIRPISVDITPESVRGVIKDDLYKLYKLIYERFLASQMTSAIYDSVVVDIEANDYGFKATGRTLEFEGYTVVYKGYVEEAEESGRIPKLTEGEQLDFVKLNTDQKFTKPPARYTEASLVKTMEEKGIGRPATYAPTITTLSYREYTEKDGKALKPTELGEVVSDYLNKYFKGVINVKFTANMESRLDDIAEKGEPWQDVIASFWNGFKDLLLNADKTSVGFKPEPIETDQICEKCGGKMLIREGKYGQFLGCSNFPKCKNIISMKSGNSENVKYVGICPECGKPMTQRTSKRGKIYYSCSNYPDCKFMSWDVPTGEKCPNCGEVIYQKVAKTKITYKCNKCDYSRIETVKEGE